MWTYLTFSALNASLGSTQSSWLLFMHIKQRRPFRRRKQSSLLGNLDNAKINCTQPSYWPFLSIKDVRMNQNRAGKGSPCQRFKQNGFLETFHPLEMFKGAFLYFWPPQEKKRILRNAATIKCQFKKGEICQNVCFRSFFLRWGIISSSTPKKTMRARISCW